MAVIRWDPYEELLAVGERMDRLLGLSWDQSKERWLPPMDVYESSDDIVIRIEAPGVRPQDIDLSLEGDTLVIRGERLREEPGDGRQYALVERRFGRFERRLPLPRGFRHDGIEARFEAGVLDITVAREEQRAPRRIEVHHRDAPPPPERVA